MSFSLPERYRQLLPVLAIVLATFLWGSSFITTAAALDDTNPLMLVCLRFSVGAALIGLVLGRKIFSIPRQTWYAGLVCSLPLVGGYVTNAMGLMTIPSSAAGFLTALYVPFTPFLVWFIYGKRPDKWAFMSISVAFAGLMLLANPFTLSWENNFGEWISIVCAFISAFEIIVVGNFAPRCQPIPLAFTQLVFVALWAALAVPVAAQLGFDISPTQWNRHLLICIAWLATIVALAQMLLSWAQRYVPAGRAAVIFAMESVFAAIIGRFAGEDLGWMGLTGGALIVAAILISEFGTFGRTTTK